MAAIIKDLGAVTAYAYAVEQGYTGTEEEFAELMASYADVAEDAAESAAAAEQAKEEALTAKTAAEAAAATATTKASAAATSADAAGSSASTATTAATTATTKAGEATTAATTATAKATEAAASAATATTAASEAADSADAAAVSEEQAEEAADYIVTHAEKLDGIEEEIYKVYPTETASGDIVSITDGAEDIPVKALTVAVEPVQDLHGQDAPYPAGGGKNLLDETLLSNVDANMRTITLNLEPNTQYTASSTLPLYNGTTADFFFHLSGESEGTNTNGVSASQSRTLTTGSDGVAVAAYRRGSRTAEQFLSYKYQVEKGSTATAYAPYSNICPITGWDAVNVVRCGVNIWDESIENGAYNTTTGEKSNSSAGRMRTTGYIPVKPNTTYRCIGNVDAVLYYDKDKQFIEYTTSVATITVPSNAYYATFYTKTNYGTTYNHDISINYPSTDTAYHAYSGTTYPIPLPSTVYGGTLDVATGVMTVTHGIVALGEQTYAYTTNPFPRFYFALQRAYAPASDYGYLANAKCSAYLVTTRSALERKDFALSIHNAGTIYVNITDSRYTDATAFKTAVTGQTLVYPIATPQTITLDPTTISTLLGSNTIYADAGQVSVTYRADVGLYIDKRIAEVQALVLES